MILIEVQYGTGQTSFMTLQSEHDGPLDENELYWLTISSSEEHSDVEMLNLRKVAVANA